jgi:hypothetical protein
MFRFTALASVFVLALANPRQLSWTDITESVAEGFSSPHHRRLAFHHELEPFVRRAPSPTVKVFELSHPEFHTLSNNQKSHATHFRYSLLALGHDTHVDIPLCTTGKVQSFHLMRSDFFGSELRAKFPDVAVFHGVSADDPEVTADVTLTPTGFRAQIWTPSTLCYVDPYSTGRADLYTSYSRTDRLQEGAEVAPRKAYKLRNGPKKSPSLHRKLSSTQWNPKPPPSGNTKLRTFKLAVPTTPEYNDWAKQHGGPMATATVSLARAMGIWRRTLGITMTLAPETAQLMTFTAADMTGFDGSNMAPLMDNGDSYFKKKLSNFDSSTTNLFQLAHWLHRGEDAGEGGLGPCAVIINGATGGSNPIGDSFDISFLAHEMGHQFGVEHTWTGIAGSCSPANFAVSEYTPNSKAAMEIGAGITIATYAGICESDNYLGFDAWPYFHVHTLTQFQLFEEDETFRSCGLTTTTANRRPTVTVQKSFAAPKKTAFVIAGSGTDPDGDALDYNWEQVDASPVQKKTTEENTQGAIFISAKPSATGNVRSLPSERTVRSLVTYGKDLSSNALERASSVPRTLHFALTARDKYSATNSKAALNTGANAVTGSWHSAVMPVEVANVGPLVVTSPGRGTSIKTGTNTISFQMQNVAASSTATDRALLSSTFDVDVAYCSQNLDADPVQEVTRAGFNVNTYAEGNVAKCGSWATVAKSVKLNSAGFGSVAITVTTPGIAVFRVSSSPVAGQYFYAVSADTDVSGSAVAAPKATTTASPTSPTPKATTTASLPTKSPYDYEQLDYDDRCPELVKPYSANKCKTDNFVHTTCFKSCQGYYDWLNSPTPAPPTTAPPSTASEDARCPGWKSFCSSNDWVKNNCKKSCVAASSSSSGDADSDSKCSGWKAYCSSNDYVKQNCKKTCAASSTSS